MRCERRSNTNVIQLSDNSKKTPHIAPNEVTTKPQRRSRSLISHIFRAKPLPCILAGRCWCQRQTAGREHGAKRVRPAASASGHACGAKRAQSVAGALCRWPAASQTPAVEARSEATKRGTADERNRNAKQLLCQSPSEASDWRSSCLREV